MDPTEFNKYILRQHHKIPDFEDLSTKMSEDRVFSTLDADRAFHQIKLSNKSSKYLVITTPFGRFRYLRMPFGICSDTEVFQDVFEEIFGDIEGVDLYVDDIRIRGKNQKEHDERLLLVLKRARERNIKFNLKKCKISCNEIKYMGHYFSDKGIKVDDEKVKAIVEMEAPKNKAQLETFLGMITYVSKFIPNLAEKNAVLRNLIKKK